MIKINYVPIYMKIKHIFFVIKGQFPVTDYIPNTIILYFIVHCIYVLYIYYCITCLCLSLTPPVSGLRCIVFNKVLFCSVLFYSGLPVRLELVGLGITFSSSVLSTGLTFLILSVD